MINFPSIPAPACRPPRDLEQIGCELNDLAECYHCYVLVSWHNNNEFIVYPAGEYREELDVRFDREQIVKLSRRDREQLVRGACAIIAALRKRGA